MIKHLKGKLKLKAKRIDGGSLMNNYDERLDKVLKKRYSKFVRETHSPY